MKTLQLQENLYVSPSCTDLKLKAEGVLCSSISTPKPASNSISDYVEEVYKW